MPVDRTQGLGRLLKRAQRRLGGSGRPGTVEVAIDEAISPLRYDVLVRQDFLAWLAVQPTAARRDTAALAEAARSLPYFTWYRDLVVEANPALLKGTTLEAAFAEQVARVEQMEAGFDPAKAGPVLLRQLSDGTETTTGKRLAARPFLVDGCHRVALLRLRGARVLPPSAYRWVDDSWPPRDNTARLLSVLTVTPDAYARFLGAGYGLACDTIAGLQAGLAALPAERADEVRRILAEDQPHLAPPAG